MNEDKSEVRYELKTPFGYAYKGDTEQASFITLQAPTYKSLAHVSPIKQAFTAAIAEVSEGVEQSDAEANADDSSDITGAAVLQLMYRWSGDMYKIHLYAAELFKSGAALIDGETALKAASLDKMSSDDFEGLVGDYIANFIAPSLMAGE
jgi:hypothetical protein